MIYKISKKEYRRIKSLQKISMAFVPCLLFKLPDGTPYKCDTLAVAGLKEIRTFVVLKKKIASEQLDLLGLHSMLQ